MRSSVGTAAVPFDRKRDTRALDQEARAVSMQALAGGSSRLPILGKRGDAARLSTERSGPRSSTRSPRVCTSKTRTKARRGLRSGPVVAGSPGSGRRDNDQRKRRLVISCLAGP